MKRLLLGLGLGLLKWRPRRRRCKSDMRLLGAELPNHVLSFDFGYDRLAGKRTARSLCAIDDFIRDCLGIEVVASLISQYVILTMTRLMRLHGKTAHISSNQVAEFAATRVMKWLRDQNFCPAFIPLGKPLSKWLCGELQRQCAG